MAYEFINFLYDTVNCAKNIEYILGSMPNTNANKYVSQKLTENKLIFPDDNDFLRGEVLKDVGESINLYIKTWDNITKMQVIKPIYEFILWDNCSNNCKFCWQKQQNSYSTSEMKKQINRPCKEFHLFRKF